MAESKVFFFDNEDPQMQQASQRARESFRYFWRELSWDRMRIIKGLELAAVKAPFADDPPTPRAEGDPTVEQMWISDIDFDGDHIHGTLINSPNWLKTVHEGDSVKKSLDEISDWMYSVVGHPVCGAFTVNLMRSRMGKAERQEHDTAWGLDFGDPNTIRVVPEWEKPGLFSRLFGKKSTEIPEHPMSDAMAPTVKAHQEGDPEFLTRTDERGWTLLHQQALAGNLATVQALLDVGANINARTNDGATPLQLANIFGWDKVITLLKSRGAK